MARRDFARIKDIFKLKLPELQITTPKKEGKENSKSVKHMKVPIENQQVQNDDNYEKLSTLLKLDATKNTELLSSLKKEPAMPEHLNKTLQQVREDDKYEKQKRELLKRDQARLREFSRKTAKKIFIYDAKDGDVRKQCKEIATKIFDEIDDPSPLDIINRFRDKLINEKKLLGPDSDFKLRITVDDGSSQDFTRQDAIQTLKIPISIYIQIPGIAQFAFVDP